MRRTIRRLLTGAVVAALLTGGTALPASAAPAPEPDTVTPSAAFSAPLVFKESATSYVAYTGGPVQASNYRQWFRATRHSTEAAARAVATTATFPGPGDQPAPVRLANGRCLGALSSGSGATTLQAHSEDCSDPVFKTNWSVSSRGILTERWINQNIGHTQAADSNYWPNSGLRPAFGAGLPLADARFDITPLVANITRIDHIARSVVLSGTATRQATVRVGSQTVPVNAAGVWTMTVGGLSVGTNTLRVEQLRSNVVVDAVTVRPTVIDGGTIVPAPTSQVELQRGGSTDVPFIVSNRAARTNMTGVVELTAPEGSTFAAGQTTVSAGVNRAGEGSAWTPLPRLDLTNGRLGADGRTLTFDLASGAGTLAAGEYYRYVLSVATSASAAPLESSMGYVYRGDSSAGDYRAAGRTATTVVGSASVDTSIGATVPGGTTDWGRSDVDAAEVRGGLTLTAPDGSRFADAEARRTSDDAPRTDYQVEYSADRETVTIDGPSDGTDARWGSGHQYAAFRLTLDADARPGSTLTGGAVAVRGTGGVGLAEGTFEVTVDEAVSSLTAEVTVLDDVTSPAVISGLGDDDGSITVREDDTVLGETTVVDGRWSLDVPTWIGPGRHDLVVSQTVDDRPFGTAEASVDLGAAVDVLEPANGKIVPGRTTVRGIGAPGAEITVTALGQTAEATVAADGTWEARVEIRPGHTAVRVDVSQHARGDIVTSDTAQVVPDAPQERRDVVITQPDSHFYTPLVGTTVRGTATPYATVDIRAQWGFVVATTEADADGDWAFDRAFGPSARYELTATQTLVDGRTSNSPVFELLADGSFVPVVVTSHADGGTYTPGEVTITGRATQGAYIEVRNQYDRLLFSTRASQVAGVWSGTTTLGPVATYDITVTQRAPDGTTGQTTVRVSPDLPFADLTVDSHTDGQTYRPGAVVLAGTATPTATVVAVNQWGLPLGETTVGTDGRWSFERELGPDADYDITFRQTFRGQSDSVQLRLLAPVWQPLAMTSPSIGERYTPGAATEFTGTATPYSTITARTALGNALFTVETGADGVWRNTRAYGPDNVYRIDIAQEARNGRTDALDTFVWSPDLPWRPLSVTSHVSGETYRPGELVLRGEGTPGAVVEITNQWDTLIGRATVGDDGGWSVRRSFGPTADYRLTLVMTRDGDRDEISDFELRAPVWSEIELVDPAPGVGYVEGRDYTMRGRATPFATIRATTSLGGQLFETTADRDGHWSNTRRYGPSHVYSIDLVQEALSGQTGDHPRFVFGPAE